MVETGAGMRRTEDNDHSRKRKRRLLGLQRAKAACIGARTRDHAIWLSVLRNRMSESVNSTLPMTSSHRNGDHTVSKPAPR